MSEPKDPDAAETVQTESDQAVDLPRFVRRFNDISGCSYSEDDFQWDLSQGEKQVAYFKAGWDAAESEAKTLLAAIVAQYDSAPDGPLGKGFTNGPFLRARNFLANKAIIESHED